MKDTPIGKLMELVKTGRPCIRYEIDTPSGCISTVNESATVIFTEPSGDESWHDHRSLADAIRERCAG